MAQAATHFADRVIPPAPQPGMCGLPLEADGFRIAGPPVGISERAGDHLRFEIIAVPLQETPH